MESQTGGTGFLPQMMVKIRFTNCTTEEHAKIYSLVRPSDDNLIGFFVPFGRIAPELGNKLLNEVIILTQRQIYQLCLYSPLIKSV